ncbi:MAG: hypothetical protein M1825_006504 [Sarcosagium campestre]|nr:MAG: hypothetical protein M1825_006504 [Sarcosagium campestre]
MGRYNFTQLRVQQAAKELLQTPRLKAPPPWYEAMINTPPAQVLVRPQPVRHRPIRTSSKTRKPSKMFRPHRMDYVEDRLRQTFFADHPWELARPRVLVENDGKDGRQYDWSKLQQRDRKVDGESVVQRQLWLIDNVPGISRAKAYDQARQEFYAIRHYEDVERRVAKEEALASGAYFGLSALEVGMKLEDKAYEAWRKWALGQSEAADRSRAAAYSDPQGEAATEAVDPAEADDADAPEVEDALQEGSTAPGIVKQS